MTNRQRKKWEGDPYESDEPDAIGSNTAAFLVPEVDPQTNAGVGVRVWPVNVTITETAKDDGFYIFVEPLLDDTTDIDRYSFNPAIQASLRRLEVLIREENPHLVDRDGYGRYLVPWRTFGEWNEFDGQAVLGHLIPTRSSWEWERPDA